MQQSRSLMALVLAADGEARRAERWRAFSAPFMHFAVVASAAEAATWLAREPIDALLLDAADDRKTDADDLRRVARLAAGRPILVVGPAHDGDGAGPAARVAAELGLARVADGGPVEICRALRRVVAECRHLEAVRGQDRLDPLTGLLAPAAFREEVAARLATRAASGLAVLDLDRLRSVNELVGREAADAVLGALGERLTGARGDDEILGVANPGRFLFWSPLERLPEAAPWRVRQLLEVVARPLRCAGQRLQLSACAGLALHPSDALGVETLVARAEAAMYRAKAAGTNGYRLHQPAVLGASPQQLKKRAVVRRELDRNALELVFEPQLDLRNERPRAARLRLRTHHEEALLQLTADDIDELALPVIRWTLETAGAQMAHWLAAEVPLVPLVVDLPLQLVHRSDVVEMVRRRLQGAGCHPAWFEVAIRSEPSSIDIVDTTTADHLQALRDLGLRVTLAGCGGRAATFGMLRHLPADSVELAADLVEGRRVRASDGTILQALVDLALALGLEVGAAGVDRPGLARELKELGCDWASGAWVGAPMPAAAFSDWLSGGGTLMSAAS